MDNKPSPVPHLSLHFIYCNFLCSMAEHRVGDVLLCGYLNSNWFPYSAKLNSVIIYRLPFMGTVSCQVLFVSGHNGRMDPGRIDTQAKSLTVRITLWTTSLMKQMLGCLIELAQDGNNMCSHISL
jgi:hypothetical protein